MPDLYMIDPSMAEPASPKKKLSMWPFAPNITHSMLQMPPMKLHIWKLWLSQLTAKLAAVKPAIRKISQSESLIFSVFSFILSKWSVTYAKVVNNRQIVITFEVSVTKKSYDGQERWYFQA